MKIYDQVKTCLIHGMMQAFMFMAP